MKILPLYLPHQGCDHQCVYCNQPLVVGSGETPQGWSDRLQSFTPVREEEWEIAFYGGTFSALPKEEQRNFLCRILPHTKKSGVLGIRISTRPDRVPEETLSFLKESGVRTIELGVESLDDEVLRRSGRGHTAAAVFDACRRIRQHGFVLGIHLMCGLPGQSEESFYRTVHESLSLIPQLVRIAPTLVLKETPLERLYTRGVYRALDLEDALRQCGYAYRVFHNRHISIIRVGLAISDENGEGTEKLVAGPWHPAFRHEVESRLVRETIASYLQEHPEESRFLIHPKDHSIVVGAGKQNRLAWQKICLGTMTVIPDASQPRHTFRTSVGQNHSLFGESEGITS